MNDGLLGLLLNSTPTPTTSSSFAQQSAFYNNLAVRPAMIAFDLMQIVDIPLNDQNENIVLIPADDELMYNYGSLSCFVNYRPTICTHLIPLMKREIIV